MGEIRDAAGMIPSQVASSFLKFYISFCYLCFCIQAEKVITIQRY